MGLWQRAVSQGTGQIWKEHEDELRSLIAEFRENPSALPYAVAGLRWLAATLNMLSTIG